MKISKEHYDTLKAAISSLPKEQIKLHRDFIACEGKAKDIEKRLRWDCANAAKMTGFICDTLYKSGLNDSHIDTALKSIMKEIGF